MDLQYLFNSDATAVFRFVCFEHRVLFQYLHVHCKALDRVSFWIFFKKCGEIILKHLFMFVTVSG